VARLELVMEVEVAVTALEVAPAVAERIATMTEGERIATMTEAERIGQATVVERIGQATVVEGIGQAAEVVTATMTEGGAPTEAIEVMAGVTIDATADQNMTPGAVEVESASTMLLQLELITEIGVFRVKTAAAVTTGVETMTEVAPASDHVMRAGVKAGR